MTQENLSEQQIAESENKTFSTEFEIIRLKDVSEEDINFTSKNEIELGTYILIKKECKKEIFFNDLHLFNIKDEIKIYYKKIFAIYKNYKNKVDIRFFYDSEYHLPGWSAKYECTWLGKMQVNNKVVFGNGGPYKIEDKLQNRGLGSYMLDSIIIWAKQNYNDAIAEISIGFPNDSDDDKKRLKHFYGKRNLKRDVKIEEIITCLENTNKIERINCEVFLLKLSNYMSKKESLLFDYESSNLNLYSSYSILLKREKCYWVSLGILTICILILRFIA
ncbi:MAG: hypothetical protein MUD14_04610 [Hydrococcus sp. Prado102]|jgi:hypothetical protein|nr:hypothetical protein [Hydrococcus sp. Prado102]